jgi:aminoglycoside phosphotransferase (APT) family kinase protein
MPDLNDAPDLDACVPKAAAAFDLPSPVKDVTAHGSGHIHQTFRVRTEKGDFLLQQLNERVFPDLEAVMENTRRIAAHLSAQVASPRRCLSLRSTRNGAFLHREADGGAWRMFDFIDDAESHDLAPSLRHIEDAARAFGEFQRQLDTLPAPALKDTLPGFHDTRRRFARLQTMIATDPAGRLDGCALETAQILARSHLAEALQARRLPVRTVHNDTKLNNLLFDRQTQQPLCVIDWDTVMPGLVAHDFGDMVRTMASDAAEDEADPARVRILPERLAAITRGYLAATQDWLTQAEIDTLPLGAQTIIFEQAVRFLTDHLEGDVYYPVSQPGHNLTRTRVQCALLESLIAQASTG